MSTAVKFNIEVIMPTLPAKFARNEVGIDRAGLVSWLKKELVDDSRNGIAERFDGDWVRVYGRADESQVLKVKEVLDYICKYNPAVEVLLYKTKKLEWYEF